jgi:small subunit ribosomal protein S8
MIIDPISDLLTRIRNAVKSKHKKVDLPHSQMKVAITEILHREGFIKGYKLFQQDNKGVLRIYLKYLDRGRSVITGLRRVSKSSRRVYASSSKLPKVRNGMGLAIVSTSRGVLTDQVARENKVGGEVICTVW